jgi:hypothetical protein
MKVSNITSLGECVKVGEEGNDLVRDPKIESAKSRFGGRVLNLVRPVMTWWESFKSSEQGTELMGDY